MSHYLLTCALLLSLKHYTSVIAVNVYHITDEYQFDHIAQNELSYSRFITNFLLEKLFHWANACRFMNNSWTLKTIDIQNRNSYNLTTDISKLLSSSLSGIISSADYEKTDFLVKTLQFYGKSISFISYSYLPKVLHETSTFLSTSTTLRFQVKASINLLQHLEWNYIALVISNDIYGIEGGRLFRERAKKKHICIAEEYIALNDLSSSRRIISYLITLAQNRDRPMKHLGVVYIGTTQSFHNLVMYAQNRVQGQTETFIKLDKQRILRWMLVDAGPSSYMAAQPLAELSGTEYEKGLLAVSLSQSVLPSLLSQLSEAFVAVHINITERRLQPMVVQWLEHFFQCSYSIQTIRPSCEKFNYNKIRNAWQMPGVISLPPNVLSALKAGFITLMKVSDNSFNLNNMNISLQFLQGAGAPFVSDLIVKYDSLSSVNGFYNELTKTGEKVLTIYNRQSLADHGLVSVAQVNRNGEFEWQNEVLFFNDSMIPLTSHDVHSICPDNCAKECVPRENKYLYIEGDFVIGILLPLHDYRLNGSIISCNAKYNKIGLEMVQAAIYAIKVINSISDGTSESNLNISLVESNTLKALNDIIPKNIKFGYVVLDSCNSPIQTTSLVSRLHESHLISKEEIPHRNRFSSCHMVGYVGGATSASSIALARILNEINLPLISPAATATILNDTTEFPYFMRTVGTDRDLASIYVQLLLKLNVSYVTVIFEPTTYGLSLKSAFSKEIQSVNICANNFLQFACDKEPCDPMIANVLDNEYSALYIALLMDERTTEKFFQVMYKEGKEKRFIFLLTEAVGIRKDVLTKFPSVSVGAFTVDLGKVATPDFESYMRRQIRNETTKESQWLLEFWEQSEQCNTKRSFMNRYQRECGKILQFPSADRWSSHVMDAVYTLALAVGKSLKDTCSSTLQKVCDSFSACNSNGEPNLLLTKKRSQTIISSILDGFKGSNWSFRKINEQRHAKVPLLIYQYQEIFTSFYDVVTIADYRILNGEYNFAFRNKTKWNNMYLPSSKYHKGCVSASDCTNAMVKSKCIGKFVREKSSLLMSENKSITISTLSIVLIFVIISMVSLSGIVLAICIQKGFLIVSFPIKSEIENSQNNERQVSVNFNRDESDISYHYYSKILNQQRPLPPINITNESNNNKTQRPDPYVDMSNLGVNNSAFYIDIHSH